MTVQRMIDLLGYRLEDLQLADFTAAVRLEALNMAQMSLVRLLDNAYLTELQVKEFAKECTIDTGDDEASYAIASLANDVVRNAITHVRYTGTGKFANMMEAIDIKRTENTLATGSNEAPRAYVYKNRIYVQCADTTPEIDIWYIKKPSDLVYTFTTDNVANGAVDGTYGYVIDVVEADLESAVDDYYNGAVVYNVTREFYAIVYDYVGGSTTLKVLYDQAETAEWQGSDEFYFVTGPGSVENLGDFECELNEALHELVVDLAEAQCWLMDNKPERAKSPMAKAMSEIQVLNARYSVEKPQGVGTESSRA